MMGGVGTFHNFINLIMSLVHTHLYTILVNKGGQEFRNQ